MSRKHLALLVGLALIWGASFMFIKVAVRELTPATLILCRLGSGALTLVLVVPFLVGGRETLRQIRENAGWLTVVGLVNTAVPFWLLSWGETRIDSGLASIIQAAVPIFNVLIAFGFFHEVRVTGIKLVGIAVGFVGVALLVGAQPQGRVLGAVAVVGMAFCYALGALLVGRHLTRVRPPVVALATCALSAVVSLPAGIDPGAASFARLEGDRLRARARRGRDRRCVSALLRPIAGAGAAYASLVTYLIPPIALVYGAIFLGEGVGAAALGGLVLVLGGVAVGTGALNPSRLRRRVAPEA